MSDWPNLVPVPELYRWLRDEVPGGWILAPVLAWVGGAALLLIAGRYFWTGLFRPSLDLVTGAPISRPSVIQAIGAGLVVLLAVAALSVLQVQIRRIRRDLRSSLVIQATIIEGLPKDLDALKKRIQDLESHTDIHGLRELLTQRILEDRQSVLSDSLRGLRDALNLRSEGEDPPPLPGVRRRRP